MELKIGHESTPYQILQNFKKICIKKFIFNNNSIVVPV